MTLRIGIAGASGRMGQALIDATLGAADLTLTAALDVAQATPDAIDAGARFGRHTGVCVGSDVEAAVAACDVLIDFTRPEGTLAHAAACASVPSGRVKSVATPACASDPMSKPPSPPATC